mgnify:FL=1
MWIQKEITINQKARGFHLITDEVVSAIPEIQKIEMGTIQVFMKHTSASLTINEDADPTVRADFESHFDQMVPENAPYYRHTFEGADDIPAHLKSSILGSSVNIPVTNGILNLGTWQGIFLCEHRNHGGSRRLVVTVQGETQ